MGAPEIYAQSSGNILDGLGFAKSGDLYASCYLPNRIYVVSPDQNVELIIEHAIGEVLNQPTNVALNQKEPASFTQTSAGLMSVPLT